MNYKITILVTAEKENAIISLFRERCWAYIKTDCDQASKEPPGFILECDQVPDEPPGFSGISTSSHFNEQFRSAASNTHVGKHHNSLINDGDLKPSSIVTWTTTHMPLQSGYLEVKTEPVSPGDDLKSLHENAVNISKLANMCYAPVVQKFEIAEDLEAGKSREMHDKSDSDATEDTDFIKGLKPNTEEMLMEKEDSSKQKTSKNTSDEKERRFKCSACGKRFFRKYHCKQHFLTKKCANNGKAVVVDLHEKPKDSTAKHSDAEHKREFHEFSDLDATDTVDISKGLKPDKEESVMEEAVSFRQKTSKNNSKERERRFKCSACGKTFFHNYHCKQHFLTKSCPSKGEAVVVDLHKVQKVTTTENSNAKYSKELHNISGTDATDNLDLAVHSYLSQKNGETFIGSLHEVPKDTGAEHSNARYGRELHNASGLDATDEPDLSVYSESCQNNSKCANMDPQEVPKYLTAEHYSASYKTELHNISGSDTTNNLDLAIYADSCQNNDATFFGSLHEVPNDTATEYSNAKYGRESNGLNATNNLDFAVQSESCQNISEAAIVDPIEIPKDSSAEYSDGEIGKEMHDNSESYRKENIEFSKVLKQNTEEILMENENSFKKKTPQNTLVEAKRRFKCSICGQAFFRKYHCKRHLAVHLESCHNNEEPLIVDLFMVPKDSTAEQTEAENKRQIYDNKDSNVTDILDINKVLKPVQDHVRFKQYKCKLCGESFTKKRTCSDHIRLHKRTFSCEKCGKIFSQKVQLEIHMFGHFDRVFECDFCDKSYKSLSSLQSHIVVAHQGKKDLVCNVCGKLFLYRNSLTRHKRIHTGLKPFSCEKCGKQFVRRDSLECHMRRHNDTKSYSCSWCSKCFSTPEYLRKHMHKKHSKGPFGPFTENYYVSNYNSCLLSNEDLTSRNMETMMSDVPLHYDYPGLKTEAISPSDNVNNLQKENTKVVSEPKNMCFVSLVPKGSTNEHSDAEYEKCMHDNSDSDPTEDNDYSKNLKQNTEEIMMMEEEDSFKQKTLNEKERRFQCSACDKTFFSRDICKQHLAVHSESSQNIGEAVVVDLFEGPCTCNFCGKVFDQLAHLESHMSDHTGYKPYKCTICSKSFSQRRILSFHVWQHKNSFCCEKCGKIFSQKVQLKVHMSKHLDGMFRCDLCEKSFNSASYLQEHLMVVHEGKKDHVCDVCGKLFLYRRTLERHKRIHTEEKPYSCEKCGKNFNRKDKLNCHLLRHNNEKSYSCSLCSKSYSTLEYLRKHINSKHKLERLNISD